MNNKGLKTVVQEILNTADIKIDGGNPWDIKVYDDKFYRKVLDQGSLGLGESYMEGLWDCKKIDELIFRILNKELTNKVNHKGILWAILKSKLLNLQKKSKAFEIGKKHYDIGNDLYQYMLDKRMVYTCGYWKKAKNLNQAQEDKLELVSYPEKIGLKKGMKVLDIGCGWGSFAKYAAEKYNVKVIGISVSKEQVKLAKELCKGLQVEIRLQDYRDINEKFDTVVSLGMFEHVGSKNYRKYMKKVFECLKENGIFLLHTIGKNESVSLTDPWMDKYIFPNGMLPSIKQIGNSIEGLFVLEDWHSFGTDYDKTLIA